MSFLVSIAIIFAVIFFLSFCILIHELGHFFVALWRGMYIERLSIGFGRKLWGKTYKNVEFVVSILPFGGYVALPQLEPTEEPVDQNGNPLPPATPTDRILTAAAGPACNILFGFLLATALWAVKLERPMLMDEYHVAAVEEGSPEYKAGLRKGDVITKLNGEDVPENWQSLVQTIVLANETVEMSIRRDGEIKHIKYEKAENPDYENLPFPFFQVRVPVVARHVESGYPAAAAGIKQGDRFLSVNGDPVQDPQQFIDSVTGGEGKPVTVTVQRDGREITFSDIKPVREKIDDKTVHIIGVKPGVPHRMVRISPWRQFVDVMARTGETLRAVISPGTGIGARHMSGPLGILAIQYQVFKFQGWRYGLSFVVLVTFNLAVLNLLPIPVLDGGHIVFACLEGLLGIKIPSRGARIIQTFFVVLLISFMLYVTFFDVNRFIKPLLPGQEEAPPDKTEENQAQD